MNQHRRRDQDHHSHSGSRHCDCHHHIVARNWTLQHTSHQEGRIMFCGVLMEHKHWYKPFISITFPQVSSLVFF